MSIVSNLHGFMARASSKDMEDVRERLRKAVYALDEEVMHDPLAFLYQDMYDAIEVLDTNIEGAYKEEKIVQENKELERKFGK